MQTENIKLLNSRLKWGDLLKISVATKCSYVYVKQIMSGARPANTPLSEKVVNAAKEIVLERWRSEVVEKQTLIQEVEAA